jgi:hypothetical protein
MVKVARPVTVPGNRAAGLDITHAQRNYITADALCNIGHLPLIGIAGRIGVRAIANWRAAIENLQAKASRRTTATRQRQGGGGIPGWLLSVKVI